MIDGLKSIHQYVSDYDATKTTDRGGNDRNHESFLGAI